MRVRFDQPWHQGCPSAIDHLGVLPIEPHVRLADGGDGFALDQHFARKRQTPGAVEDLRVGEERD